MTEDGAREITVEVGENRMNQIMHRLDLAERATGVPAKEIARRYFRYGMLYHEKAMEKDD